MADHRPGLGSNQPHPQGNRASRRARPPKAVRLLGQLPRPDRSEPLPPHIGGSAPLAAEALTIELPDKEMPRMAAAPGAPNTDKAPADRAERARAAGQASAAKRAQKVLDAANAKSAHDAHLVRTLTGYHGLIGLAIGRRDMYDGQVWMIQGKAASEAWVDLGREHEQVMRVLEIICAGGPVVAIITAYAGAVVGMMARHGQVPVEAVDMFGLPRPDEVVKAAPRPGGNHPRVPPAARAGASPPTDTGTPEPPAGEPPAPQFSPEPGAQAAADGELPHDVELAVRELSRTQGIPYEEVRAAALAQMRDYQVTAGAAPSRPPAFLGEVVAP